MKAVQKKLPKSQIEIEFEITAEEFQKHIDDAVLHLQEHIKVDGFRQGQAPRKIIEERAGEENLLMEAGDLAVKDNYSKFVLENDIEPIAKPEVQVLKIPARHNASALGGAKGEPAQSPSGNEAGENFVFKIKTTILPEIDLPDYRKIVSRIKKKEISVSQEEIEDALDYIRKSRAKFSQLDRPAQEKDFIEIEYKSKDINNNKEIKDEFILGEGKLIPGFENNLVGMKAGEEKEFSLKFPQNSSRKDLAEKEAIFKVKMLTVQKVELPESNDEFAKSLGKFDNIDSLKANIKEGLVMEKETQEKQRQRNEILEGVAQKTKIEIPEVLIDVEKERLFKDFQQNISQNFKITFQEYLVLIKQDEKTLKDSFLKEAEKKVKKFLILRKIGKKENVLVDDNEVEEAVNETLGRSPTGEAIKNYPIDAVKKIDIQELKEYTKEVIYNEKVFQKLETFVKN